jgi:hypothetical protein
MEKMKIFKTVVLFIILLMSGIPEITVQNEV